MAENESEIGSVNLSCLFVLAVTSNLNTAGDGEEVIWSVNKIDVVEVDSLVFDLFDFHHRH